MAGHSKWANIQHRKAAQDSKRGKLFTKLIREITVAARAGGGDPAANPRLRLAIDKANKASMPKDKVERAVKKGSGELEGESYEEVRFEGYGPGGVAVMVDCVTDNRNRTVAEVRHAFAKYGGNLGTDGSVGYLFRRCGQIIIPDVDEDAVLEVALEAGAEDIVDQDGAIEVLCAPDALEAVTEALEAAGFTPDASDVTERPETQASIDGDTAQSALKLLDALEDLDDVQNVYSNADFPEELMVAD